MVGRARTWVAGSCVAAATAAAVLIGSPVYADVSYTPSPQTSAFVTQVGLDHGTGEIDVQVRQPARADRVTGVVVRIPAAGGTWGTRTINTGGARCVASDGPGLEYDCVPIDGGLMPSGSYDLVLPVARRTGSIAGVWGSVSIVRQNFRLDSTTDLTYASDTFPVVDRASGVRSTGEVRFFDVSGTRGTLSVTAVVVTGDPINRVVLTLPAAKNAGWVLGVSRPALNGSKCSSAGLAGSPGALVITCAFPGQVFPMGPTTINLPIKVSGQASVGVGTVAVGRSGAAPVQEDTFGIRDDFRG